MAVESSKMTRNQVHEKLKENFQALYARCPQVNEKKDCLDDSLTNLQWLWNLNVNISSPVDGDIRNCYSRSNGSTDVSKTSMFVANRKYDNRRFKSSGGRVRQNKSNGFVKNPCDNFYSTNSRHKVLTNQSDLRNESVTNTSSRTVDVIGPIKNKEEKGIFFTKSQLDLNLLGFEEKPDVSKINFLSKNDSYPLLSDASIYPITSGGDIKERKNSQSNLIPVRNEDINIKPPHSISTLIVLALQSSQTGCMCLPSICQWIKDNVEIYKASSDNSWQKIVEKTLKKSDAFSKVPKKRSRSRKTLWEVSTSFHEMNKDFLSFSKLKSLKSIPFNFSSHKGVFGSDFNRASMNLLNRKRKQTMPQKIVRLCHEQKRRRYNNTDLTLSLDQLEDLNPFRDQASEVGSLKGDFNWNTIFDDFTSDNLLNESSISSSNNSSSSQSVTSPDLQTASSFFSLAFSNLTSNRSNKSQLTFSELDQNSNNNENLNLFANDDFNTNSYDAGQDEMEKLLNGDSMFNSISDMDSNVEMINDESISINEFFPGALDLTVQGHHITAPAEWEPVGTGLETILCESQDNNLSPIKNR